jgi:ATP-dependent DNA helicase DinG
VVVFDRRVMTKQYGRAFIDSLPQCTMRAGSLHQLAETAASWLNL